MTVFTKLSESSFALQAYLDFHWNIENNTKRRYFEMSLSNPFIAFKTAYWLIVIFVGTGKLTIIEMFNFRTNFKTYRIRPKTFPFSSGVWLLTYSSPYSFCLQIIFATFWDLKEHINFLKDQLYFKNVLAVSGNFFDLFFVVIVETLCRMNSNSWL